MKTFIFFESRYKGLSSLLKDESYTQKIMGEITWFLSLMKYLQSQENIKVIHCSDLSHFILSLKVYEKNDLYLIMDYLTIPKTINLLNLNKTYCMCFWGRDKNSIKELGNKNGEMIPLKNVLTPFDYNNENTYLGYDLDKLCYQIGNEKYNREYGIIWGKDIEYINIKLVTQLCQMGIRFYSTSKTLQRY